MPRIPTLLLAITLAFGPAAQADETSAAHDPDQRAVITMDPASRPAWEKTTWRRPRARRARWDSV